MQELRAPTQIFDSDGEAATSVALSGRSGIWAASSDGGMRSIHVLSAMDEEEDEEDAAFVPAISLSQDSFPGALPVITILPLLPSGGGSGDSVLAVSPRGLSAVNNGGVVGTVVMDREVEDITCAALRQGIHTTTVACGRAAPLLSIVDFTASKFVQNVNLNARIACIQTYFNSIVAGSINGDITLRDVREGMRVAATISAHQGSVVALDVKESASILASCGFQRQMGELYMDPLIKIFDMRSTGRVLQQINFRGGPIKLEFIPRFSSTLLVTGASGAFATVDVLSTELLTPYQVDNEGAAITASAVSDSGQIAVFSDSFGYMHVWGYSEESLESVFEFHVALPSPPTVPDDEIEIDEQTVSLSSCQLDAALYDIQGGKLISSLDLDTVTEVGRSPRIVDKSIAERLTDRNGIGYAPNPFWKGGMQPGETYADVYLLQQQRVPVKIGGEGRRERKVESSMLKRLPKGYKRVMIDMSSRQKFEDFDFSLYNSTRFPGLENGMPNCYCNALIQTLYYQAPFRYLAMRSMKIDIEFALLDELGLLFRMLGTSETAVCSAGNLLRAIRQLREAFALGLLDDITYGNDVSSLTPPLAARMQSLCSFMIEQIAKEQGDGLMTQLFGIGIVKKVSSADTLLSDTHRSRKFLLDPLYPPHPPPSKLSADDRIRRLLKSSMISYKEMKAWFAPEQAFKQVHRERIADSLPPILIVNCGISDENDFNWWFASEEDQKQANLRPNAGQKSCIPLRVRITLGTDKEDVQITPLNIDSELEEGYKATQTSAVYDLSSHIALIRDEHQLDADDLDMAQTTRIGRKTKTVSSVDGYTGHLVSFIRIRYPYIETGESILTSTAASLARASLCSSSNFSGENTRFMSGTNPEWFLFNDFNITVSNRDDVVTLYGRQKIPVLLFYSRVEGGNESAIQSYLRRYKEIPRMSISKEDYKRLTKPVPGRNMRLPLSFRPLNLADPREDPRSDFLVAIDCEFVCLAAALTEKGDDGSETTIRPARLSLARVSVLRGNCHFLQSEPFIDDYIRSVEPIHDYLTRFSGIEPSDLDPAMSRYYVTTLKETYLKLRYLVDVGCVFVGHGLKSDFRTINIVVPPNQIIDTVELFYLRGKRKLKLRFLTSYLLGADIQSNSHDSIEDARAALGLYQKYLELQESGKYESVLEEIYRYGRSNQWEVRR